MAGGAMGDDDEGINDINVTPLVDVVLVLLIIFMVTATTIVQKSINVTLPKAATAEATDVSKNLAFVIDKESTLYLDGEEVDFASLATIIEKVRSELQDEQKLQALITADAATPHGQVVKLIDAVRKNGINEFAINVEADFAADGKEASNQAPQ